MDLFGVGKIADAVKTGEWIGAIFAGLAWALGHPSTAAWAVGATLILAVLRKGWPFANVPNVDSFLGKALVTVGLVLICGGFAWRAADEITGRQPVSTSQATPKSSQKGVSGPTSKPAQGKVSQPSDGG